MNIKYNTYSAVILKLQFTIPINRLGFTWRIFDAICTCQKNPGSSSQDCIATNNRSLCHVVKWWAEMSARHHTSPHTDDDHVVYTQSPFWDAAQLYLFWQ